MASLHLSNAAQGFRYSPKNAASVSCEALHIVHWRLIIFLIYTAFGVSHFLLKAFVAFHIKNPPANEKE